MVLTDQQFLNKLPEQVKIEGYYMDNAVMINGRPLPLNASLKVMNHSPSGFNWGYGGSGPAQFALALLMVYVDSGTAVRYYQRLKWGWITGLPRTDFIKTVNLKQIMTDILNR